MFIENNVKSKWSNIKPLQKYEICTVNWILNQTKEKKLEKRMTSSKNTMKGSMVNFTWKHGISMDCSFLKSVPRTSICSVSENQFREFQI